MSRAALQAGTADPSLPIVGSFGYAVWLFVNKRKNRNPEGPFWGNNPLWGALLSSISALLLGAVVRSHSPLMSAW